MISPQPHSPSRAAGHAYPSCCAARRRAQSGFSLIEVLVSIVVMAFGLLGASSLMMNAVNNATQTEISGRATQLAYEVMDAMRANRSAAVNGDYVIAYGATLPSATGTIAQQDLNRWLSTLRALPGGDGKVERVGTTNEFTVTVRFTNCLGTLSGTEKTNCQDTNAANANTRKREISFQVNIW